MQTSWHHVSPTSHAFFFIFIYIFFTTESTYCCLCWGWYKDRLLELGLALRDHTPKENWFFLHQQLGLAFKSPSPSMLVLWLIWSYIFVEVLCMQSHVIEVCVFQWPWRVHQIRCRCPLHLTLRIFPVSLLQYSLSLWGRGCNKDCGI